MVLKKITREVIEQAANSNIKEDDDNTESIKTGFKDYDHLTGGLWRGETYILAGKTESGKTTLVHNLINNISIKQGYSTVYLSLDAEESKFVNRLMQVVERDLLPPSMNGKVYSVDSIYNCEMIWKQTVEKIENADIYCDDCKQFTSEMLLKSVKKLNKPVDIIIIDSLSYIDDMAAGLENVIKGIRDVATKLCCVVIVVYQIKDVCGNKDSSKSLELARLNKNNEVDNILLLSTDVPSYFKADITITKSIGAKDVVVSLAYNPFLQEFRSL